MDVRLFRKPFHSDVTHAYACPARCKFCREDRNGNGNCKKSSVFLRKCEHCCKTFNNR